MNIGIDAPTLDNPADSKFSTHLVIGRYGRCTMTENLANLKQVVNQRFVFIGLPLKLRDGTGSPVRAVAILPD